MRTCLLLGGSGFIGGHLIRRLQGKYKVVVFSQVPPDEHLLTQDVEYVEGDFTAIEDFSALLQGVDVVFHMISTTVPTDTTAIAEKDITENILPTIRLLEALKEQPQIKLFFISSGGTVYGNHPLPKLAEETPLQPICSYGLQKALIEQYIAMYHRLYKLPYQIVRLSNPYGVEANVAKKQGIIPIFIRKVLKHEPISIWGDGKTIRDYIFIEDAMDAVSKLIEYTGDLHVFNVGSGEGHSINEIIQIIAEQTGIADIKMEYMAPRSCDVRVNILDVNRIRQETGWMPQTNLRNGIQRILQGL